MEELIIAGIAVGWGVITCLYALASIYREKQASREEMKDLVNNKLEGGE